MDNIIDEKLLEQLYWEFDAERKKGNKSERDIFKGKMRFFATETIALDDLSATPSQLRDIANAQEDGL